MLKPLAVQSLLDALTSSSSGLSPDTGMIPNVAMLALAESGQLFAASSSGASSSSKPTPLSQPHPRFESLMCPVAVKAADFEQSGVFDDQKVRALSALATKAWSEWRYPKRDKRNSRSRRTARHETSTASARSAYDGSMSYLTLKSEEYGIIHVQPLLPTRPQPARSPPVSLPSSPRVATLDEEETQFSAPDVGDATLLLILSAEAPSVNGDIDAHVQSLRTIAGSVAKALGPNLPLLDS